MFMTPNNVTPTAWQGSCPFPQDAQSLKQFKSGETSPASGAGGNLSEVLQVLISKVTTIEAQNAEMLREMARERVSKTSSASPQHLLRPTPRIPQRSLSDSVVSCIPPSPQAAQESRAPGDGAGERQARAQKQQSSGPAGAAVAGTVGRVGSWTSVRNTSISLLPEALPRWRGEDSKAPAASPASSSSSLDGSPEDRGTVLEAVAAVEETDNTREPEAGMTAAASLGSAATVLRAAGRFKRGSKASKENSALTLPEAIAPAAPVAPSPSPQRHRVGLGRDTSVLDGQYPPGCGAGETDGRAGETSGARRGAQMGAQGTTWVERVEKNESKDQMRGHKIAAGSDEDNETDGGFASPLLASPREFAGEDTSGGHVRAMDGKVVWVKRSDNVFVRIPCDAWGSRAQGEAEGEAGQRAGAGHGKLREECREDSKRREDSTRVAFDAFPVNRSLSDSILQAMPTALQNRGGREGEEEQEQTEEEEGGGGGGEEEEEFIQS